VAAELHDAGPTCFFDHASDLKFDQRFETYCPALALWRFFTFRARRRKQVIEALKLAPTDSTVSETQRLGPQVDETATYRSAADSVHLFSTIVQRIPSLAKGVYDSFVRPAVGTRVWRILFVPSLSMRDEENRETIDSENCIGLSERSHAQEQSKLVVEESLSNLPCPCSPRVAARSCWPGGLACRRVATFCHSSRARSLTRSSLSCGLAWHHYACCVISSCFFCA
jgi:hypothetical protein